MMLMDHEARVLIELPNPESKWKFPEKMPVKNLTMFQKTREISEMSEKNTIHKNTMNENAAVPRLEAA